METFSAQNLRLNPQMCKPGVIHLGVTSNLQDPGSHKSKGVLELPLLPRARRGPRPGERERGGGGSGWNQSETLWRGVEVGGGKKWQASP